MSKRTMWIIGIVAVVVVGAAFLFGPSLLKSGTQSGTGAGTGTSTTSGSGSGTSSTATVGTTKANGSTTTTASGTGKTGGSSTTMPRGDQSGAGTGSIATSGSVNPNLSKFRAFPPMAPSTQPPRAPTAPEAAGQALAPLTSAPENTISALETGKVPDGSVYTVTIQPYGMGPTMPYGSRIAIRVNKFKPLGKAPGKVPLANANMLVIADTTTGGGITKGGTYSAVLVFRSDGTKLWPILQRAKATK